MVGETITALFLGLSFSVGIFLYLKSLMKTK